MADDHVKSIASVLATTLASEQITKAEALQISTALVCASLEEIREASGKETTCDILFHAVLPLIIEAAGGTMTTGCIDGDEDDLPPEGTTIN